MTSTPDLPEAPAVTDSPITLDQLRVFLTVVEAGSFSRAARRLRRVQSAVSYSIANLERLLDVELFDRTGRTPTLTAAGRALAADARSVHARVAKLEAHAQTLVGGVEPEVSVRVDVAVPPAAMTYALQDIATGFPGVEVTWRAATQGGVERGVRQGHADLGVALAWGPCPPELAALRLGVLKRVPVCGAAHPLAAGPVDGRRIGDALQLVVHGVDGGEPDRPSLRLWRLPDHHRQRELIVAGVGWGVMPEHLALDALAAGQLARVEPLGWAIRDAVDIVALYRRESPPGPAGRRLLDALASQLHPK